MSEDKKTETDQKSDTPDPTKVGTSETRQPGDYVLWITNPPKDALDLTGKSVYLWSGCGL